MTQKTTETTKIHLQRSLSKLFLNDFPNTDWLDMWYPCSFRIWEMHDMQPKKQTIVTRVIKGHGEPLHPQYTTIACVMPWGKYGKRW